MVDSILAKFGHKVNNASSAKKLILDIENETGEELSYNTVRRFFGIINNGTSNYHLKTINIFSRYCGFKNYSDQLKHYTSFKSWKLINYIGFSDNEIEDFTSIVHELGRSIALDSKSFLHLAILTNRLLLQKNETQLLLLYDITIKNIYEKNIMMQVTNCCNLFANTLRNYQFKDPKNLVLLAQKETFVRLYLHHFVDYGVNPNYIELLKNTDDKMFSATDFAYKHLFQDRYYFLTGADTLMTHKGLNIPYSELENDFVRGRWIAGKYLIDKELNFRFYYKEGPTSIVLATEILVFALINDDFKKIKEVCEPFSFENIRNLEWNIINEKVLIELFLILSSFLKNQKISRSLNYFDILGNSNNQCLEYNKTIYYYIKTIMEGGSNELEQNFKLSKSRTSLKKLKLNNALKLYRLFSN